MRLRYNVYGFHEESGLRVYDLNNKRGEILRILLAALLSSFIFTGCSQKAPEPKSVPASSLDKQDVPSDAPKANYGYVPNGLTIQYKASKDLNFFEGSPHTIIAVIYQMDSVDAFNNLVKTAAGIEKLLGATKFDPSVKSMSQYIIQPGEENNISTYRAQDAQWIGIVGGYYDLQPGHSTAVQKVPVKYGTSGIWPFGSSTTTVLNMKIDIDFGQDSLQSKGYFYEEQ